MQIHSAILEIVRKDIRRDRQTENIDRRLFATFSFESVKNEIRNCMKLAGTQFIEKVTASHGTQISAVCSHEAITRSHHQPEQTDTNC